MTEYKNVVMTTKGTYRLWDKDFMDSVDLSPTGSTFLGMLLSDDQRRTIYNHNEAILTDVQYKKLHEYYVI